MSQQPIDPNMHDPNDTAPEGPSEDASPDGPSRRTFLQYAGVGFAVATLPALPGCAVESEVGTLERPEASIDVEAALAATTWVEVVRRDDLLAFSIGLVNLSVRNRLRQQPPVPLTLKGDLYLQRLQTGPAFLIVKFQPQHLLEKAFDDLNGPNPAGGRTPIDHRIADPSRVVFVVPSNVQVIPYELDKLLDALTQYQMNVAINATPNPADIILRPPVFGGPPVAFAKDAAPAALVNAGLKAARARNANVAFAKMNPEAAGGGGGSGPPPPPPPIPIPTIPTQPSDLETAIELPFRMEISPNAYGQWAHSTTADAMGAAKRVELWHTRLTTPESWQKTIRALWTRDTSFSPYDAGGAFYQGQATPEPFSYASMYDSDRGDIVHLTTNLTLLDASHAKRAHAVDVKNLMLSTLGGWLDAHGKWNAPLKGISAPSVVAWDHIATMARDHYVRVVRFGYLYPFGHQAVHITITERRFKDVASDTPYLWQNNYVVVKEPIRTYDGLTAAQMRAYPFKSLRFKTLATPSIDQFSAMDATVAADFSNSGWISVQGKAFHFEVEAYDHDGNVHDFTTAAIFVDFANATLANTTPSMQTEIAASWAKKSFTGEAAERRRADLKSQRVSYADSHKPDDTRYTTVSMAPVGVWTATPGQEAPFIPQLSSALVDPSVDGSAQLDIDTIRGISGKQDPQLFKYNQVFLDSGWDPVANKGEVLLEVVGAKPSLDVSKMTHKSGGFVAPSLNVSAVSRKQGIVGGAPNDFASGNAFDPAQFFDSLGANLFGVIPISGIISAIDPDLFKQTPKFITQGLAAIEEVLQLVNDAGSMANDLSAAASTLMAVAASLPVNPTLTPNAPPSPALTGDALALYPRVLAKAAALKKTGADFAAQAQSLIDLVTGPTGVVDAMTKLGAAMSAITSLGANPNYDQLATDLVTALTNASAKLSAVASLLPSLQVPLDSGQLGQALGLFGKVAQWLSANLGTIQTVALAFVKAEDAIANLHIKLDWGPKLAPWPAPDTAVFWPNDVHGFHVGVEIRGKESGGNPAGADVYASLVDFELRLLGKDPYLKLVFDKLAFKAGTADKPSIDCVFRGLHFGGALSFVETLRQFIPLDGFSDPPNVEVTAEGLKAQFGIPLPNIAVGMFSLENLSFNAGFQIPFIGKSLAVDFSFCTRESPFVLTVCMIGGGGFVGLTICPDGVQKLEISLEAAAVLALDFGVASGSISIAVGIYLCIEKDDVSLSGYVKIHGEVQVLGIVSASLTLALELSYESKTGKVIGEASLEIHVSILCFGVTVSVHVQKKFKGSNGDPTFRQMMAPDPMDPTFIPWNDYCAAFVPVG